MPVWIYAIIVLNIAVTALLTWALARSERD